MSVDTAGKVNSPTEMRHCGTVAWQQWPYALERWTKDNIAALAEILGLS